MWDYFCKYFTEGSPFNQILHIVLKECYIQWTSLYFIYIYIYIYIYNVSKESVKLNGDIAKAGKKKRKKKLIRTSYNSGKTMKDTNKWWAAPPGVNDLLHF